MKTVLLPALAVAAMSAAPASGQDLVFVPAPAQPYRGYDTLPLSRAATSGDEIRIWWAQMAKPDCTVAGKMTTTVVDQPKHGTVRISDDPFFASFPESNPRFACDTRKIAGKQAFYTSSPEFKGHDRVTLQNATSEGRIRKIIVDIDVR